MNTQLTNPYSDNVFNFFYELTKIPHGSGDEEAISDFLVRFAEKRELPVEKDTYNNVIIRKAASAGYENAPVTMLQGHMDMVCEKLPEIEFDFKRDSIKIVVDEDKGIISSEGTSLGADNGIGLAVCLAILDDDTVIHPALEVVFTTREEDGFHGVKQMDTTSLKSKYMISTDGFELHTVQAGCAGCIYSVTEQNINWIDNNGTFDETARLVVAGLRGGHSGLDICRQRTNANKLMGRLLDMLRQRGIVYSICGYSCVNNDNSIARNASCEIAFKTAQKEQLVLLMREFSEILQNELKIVDPDITCRYHWGSEREKVLSPQDVEKMVTYLKLVPDGLFTHDSLFNNPNLAESSSNLGKVIFTDEKILYRSMIRANIESRKYEAYRNFKLLADLLEMKNYDIQNTPAWEYDKNSPLLSILQDAHMKIFKNEIGISVSHGTSECGIFKDKIQCDVVCLGADIWRNHSPYEYVSMESSRGLYELTKMMLKEIAQCYDKK